MLTIYGREKKNDTIKNLYEIVSFAKKYKFEIIIDINPKVLGMLGIEFNDLSFFKELNVDGIRLDYGFGGNEESLMTFNPENLDIEINMSNDTHYIETIMDFYPNRYKLRGCHNFYPHRYSGLSISHFKSCSHRFKKFGLKTAAFVTSQATNTFGPWPVTEGLPTLEAHRDLPLLLQIKHLIAMDEVDDIIISNCYPTDEELYSLNELSLCLTTLNVVLEKNIPDVERSILLDELHYNRGDVSGNMIRSTVSRVKYKGHNFSIFNVPDIIRRGDVIVESSLYGHYAGEMQIALTDMVNSGKSNVVGQISSEELFLLDEVKPWKKFKLKEAK